GICRPQVACRALGTIKAITMYGRLAVSAASPSVRISTFRPFDVHARPDRRETPHSPPSSSVPHPMVAPPGAVPQSSDPRLFRGICRPHVACRALGTIKAITIY
ncbi:uncharacterized protein SCHCODRAFT_01046019, partial [Schizophyllum commune H4-8]|uniref:uncharacterized protein n=1 Tax=Schizophyllum commune (strain H4-8 / FGSC 9210) TaxID=578458 RepID=UPI00215F7D0C